MQWNVPSVPSRLGSQIQRGVFLKQEREAETEFSSRTCFPVERKLPAEHLSNSGLFFLQGFVLLVLPVWRGTSPGRLRGDSPNCRTVSRLLTLAAPQESRPKVPTRETRTRLTVCAEPDHAVIKVTDDRLMGGSFLHRRGLWGRQLRRHGGSRLRVRLGWSPWPPMCIRQPVRVGS